MFFGLEVKSSQKQAKPITLLNNLKLTQAVLEPTKNGKKEPVSLVIEYEKKQSILCVLDPSLAWQSALDVMFASGSQLKFSLRGTGTVHLTGYEIQDDFDDISVSMSSGDDVSITSEDDDDNAVQVEELSSAKKLKKGANKRIEPQTNGVKVPAKKRKISPKPAEQEDDDDDSDDLDFDEELDSASSNDDLSLDDASDGDEGDDDDDDDDEEIDGGEDDEDDDDEEISDVDSDKMQ